MIIELLKKQTPLKRLQRYENYAIAERFSTNQIRKKCHKKTGTCPLRQDTGFHPNS